MIVCGQDFENIFAGQEMQIYLYRLILSLWFAVAIGFYASTAYAGHDKQPVALDNLSYARLTYEQWKKVVIVETVLDDPKNNVPSDDESATADPNVRVKFVKPFVVKQWLDKRAMGMRSVKGGTGFVCGASADNKKIFICTNAHVIEGGREITVTTADDKTHRASVLAENHDRDIAVLAIEIGANSDNFSPVAWGDANSTAPGEAVMTVGHPQDLFYSVTHGIVSGKRIFPATKEKSSPRLSFVQLDMTVNFGSSGSPVFNMKGEVIGAVVWVLGRSQGIAFAIPAADFQNMLKDIAARQRQTAP